MEDQAKAAEGSRSLVPRRREEAPLRPNALMSNLDATSSTFDQIGFGHCIFNNLTFTNSLFFNADFKGVSFQRTSFDGTGFQRCSLRGVQIQNCDIEGLVINGIEVGALLNRLIADSGGSK
jgi:uncharacterized protein YjbI with pentapeptide repeats